MSRRKDLLKNEYVKSLILLAIILGAIAAFWFGLRIYLRTDYPLLAVASGSMIPTLNVGDLIVVQGGFHVNDIVAAYGTGDIIVFHKPGGSDELIVHRAVAKFENGAFSYIVTKGDNNPGPDPWRVYDRDLVGKVVWSIPYLGNIPLFVHTPTGMTIIVILIVILILVEFIIPSTKEKKESEETEEKTDVLDVDSV
jgi:signal peptidase